MNARQKSSQSQGKKSRRLVKNKVMIGDSKLRGTVKPEMRGPGDRYSSTNTVNRSNKKWQQLYADNSPGNKQKRVDGSNYNKEVGAKKPRATSVYGSRKKALKASYRKDKMTCKVIEGSKYKEKKKPAPKQTGGLISRPKGKAGSATNPIIGSAGRPASKRRTSGLI